MKIEIEEEELRRLLETVEVISNAPVRLDFPAFADALADIDYVVEGARLTFGIPRVPVALEVQRANMAKDRAPGNAPGTPAKAVKPPGWQPPDIEGVLRRAGWRGR